MVDLQMRALRVARTGRAISRVAFCDAGIRSHIDAIRGA